MSVGILHLSDIHFTNGSNPVEERAGLIAAAARSTRMSITTWLVLVTGDVAFSGSASEYNRARSFLAEVVKELAACSQSVGIEVFAVPGNHDCDHSANSAARTVITSSVLSSLSSVDLDSDLVPMCVNVQDHFFEFERQYRSGGDDLGARRGKERLFYGETIDAAGLKIRVNCFNTALLSHLHEQPGRLGFPTHAAFDICPPDAGLVVSMLHHPFNWFEPNNARDVRSMIESASDLVLTGHEHVRDAYQKLRDTEAITSYVEAPQLQSEDQSESAFSVITVDASAGRYERAEYKWNGERYHETNREVRPFARKRRAFSNLPEFELQLDSTGTAFIHPGKKELTLRDIFVYPHLTEVPLSKKEIRKGPLSKRVVRGREVVTTILKKKFLMIIGPESSGKTSLAKMLYRDLQDLSLVPVLISGDTLRSANAARISRLVEERFSDQYGRDNLDPYRQLKGDQRVIIVDDFHRARIGKAAWAEATSALEQLASYVVLLGGDSFPLEEIVNPGSGPNPFQSFDRVRMREFGFELRARLIETWLRIGRDPAADDQELQHEVTTSEAQIDALLGKGLFPSYPLPILLVLQVMATGRLQATTTGSFGQLYEALIAENLTRAARRYRFDTLQTYIARLAFRMFDRGADVVSSDDIDAVNDEYFSRNRIRIERDEMTTSLVRARIIEQRSDGYHFCSKLFYYYFVAKYFDLEMREADSPNNSLRARLNDLADRCGYEDFANILIFYVYLTKDGKLIKRIVDNANSIFADTTPTNLADDVEFINRLYKERPQIVLPPTSPEENREARRRSLDEMKDEGEPEVDTDPVAYAPDLDPVTKFTIAFSTLQVMGQILRNFPGSLVGEVKLSITKACYLLSLRMLNALLQAVEGNLEDLRTYFSQVLSNDGNVTEEDLPGVTDELLATVLCLCAYGTIKLVSRAVGDEQLCQTYLDLRSREVTTPAIRLIELSIRLDHFRETPVSMAEALHHDLSHNIFSHSLLRYLVAEFLHLRQCDYRVKQRLSTVIAAKVSNPAIALGGGPRRGNED